MKIRVKLVDDPEYAKLRKKEIALIVIPSFLIGLPGNFLELSFIQIAALIFLCALCVYLLFENRTKLKELSRNRSIELDNNHLRILSGQEEVLESIDLEQVDSVVVSAAFQDQS